MSYFLAFTLLIFSLLGYFADLAWWADLFSHFRQYYLFVSVLLLLIFVLIKNKSKGIYVVFLAVILINTFEVAPFYFTKKDVHTDLNSTSLKVVSLNLYSGNVEKKLALDYLTNSSADIIIVSELTPEWANELQTLNAIYPYAKAIVQNGNFGIGAISKYPIDINEVIFVDESRIPILDLSIELSSRNLNFIAAHAFPPIGAIGSELRSEYFQSLIAAAKKSNPEFICGDFNATPWSIKFKNFFDLANMRLPMGHGILKTWPVTVSLLAIPIDHCLVSNENTILSYKKGIDVGSDHYPLELNLILGPAREVTSEISH